MEDQKIRKNAEKDRLFSVEKTCILKGKNREYFCQLERRNAECILYRKKGPILIWILPAIRCMETLTIPVSNGF